MKYGESLFDVLYLCFAIASGIVILKKARNKTEKMMGLAALVLGCGDAFHLVPRVLNYFIKADFTAPLGIGKLVTSVTMTLFYVLMYEVWSGYYHEAKDLRTERIIWLLAALRIVLCLFPQNQWLTNGNDLTWSILRNVPFVILGGIIIVLYFRKCAETKTFRPVWLYILLSFLFYIPVAVGAMFVPMLGMLMLPKTICYVLILVSFLKAVLRDTAQ